LSPIPHKKTLEKGFFVFSRKVQKCAVFTCFGGPGWDLAGIWDLGGIWLGSGWDPGKCAVFSEKTRFPARFWRGGPPWMGWPGPGWERSGTVWDGLGAIWERSGEGFGPGSGIWLGFWLGSGIWLGFWLGRTKG